MKATELINALKTFSGEKEVDIETSINYDDELIIIPVGVYETLGGRITIQTKIIREKSNGTD